MLLGNRRFSWREIAKPLSLLKKRCFDKLYTLFTKTIVLQYCSFKLEKKHLITINGKKKFKGILSCLFGGRRKVQVTKSASEDFMFVFSRVFFTTKSLSCSETTD